MKMWKKISVSALLILVMGIFSCEDPTAPTAPFPVIVSGTVINKSTAKQDSVVITLDNPFRRDTTKSDGSFSYTFSSTEKNEVTASFKFTHINLAFRDTTLVRTYSSTKNTITFGEVTITGVTSAQDSILPTRASARAGVIVFIRSASPIISIRGAGNDATNLTFEVRDSLGNPVDEKNKVSVAFKLVTKPDILTELNRVSATTNSIGQVVVQLSAGNKAGIAQVQATTTAKNAIDTTKTDTLKSQVVSVTIAGGLPVASRFTIGSQKVNIPGLVKFNLRNTITAVVGDTFGNPVQQGTFVYFSTTGGIILPFAKTSGDGTVGVDLITGNPVPANGLAIITAQVGTPGGATPDGVNSEITMDEAVVVKGLRGKRQSNDGVNSETIMDEAVVVKGLRGKRHSKSNNSSEPSKTNSTAGVFSKTINVLFTGAPRVTSNDSTFIVPPLGTKQIQFTVDDINGNPMSEGTTIKVSGIGLDTTGAVLTGDIDNILRDVNDKSYTKFNISIADRRTKNLSASVPITINVEVAGENGNIKKSFTGFLASGVSDSGKVGSISLVNTSVDSLVASGAGSPNSVVIQAKVLTATGQPSPNISVNFSIIKSVNGGEYISAPITFTDANGIASTTLFAGVRAGLMQVQASVRRDLLAISTEPKSVYIRTGKTASISVVSVSSASLSVKGGGGNENAILIFEAQDSLGNPVDVSNQSTITFSMIGDTSGAKVSPASAKTDPNTGRVTASFSSGTRSGIVQIRAISGAIASPPATITIAGGFAVDSLFNFTGLKKNYSIFESSPVTIEVLAGDQSGNPVKTGTPIYFTTDAGVISAASFTDNSGKALASLQIVNNKKLLGQRFVSAKTIAANSTEVKKTRTFILSGVPIINTVNVVNDSVTLFDGSSTTINFTIADSLGNPISGGHAYSVALEGGVASQLSLTGNVSGSLPDGDDKVNDIKFNFNLADALPNSGTGGNFKIKITVTGVTGTTIKTINGKLLAPSNIIVPPSARVPASIALISASTTDLSIAGVGGTENATLMYEVRDSVGAPITSDIRTKVSFKANFFPNTFVPGGTTPTILPTLDSTDENGRVRVAIISGTQAGAVQIEAVINLTNPVRTIKSQPVKISVNSGFADQAHFTIAPLRFNFAGLQKAFFSMPITVQLGDKFSNPVKEGTTVYFNTANGVIQTSLGLTDKNGFVTMTLFASNPFPLTPKLASGLTNGFSRVYARTIGRDSTFIADSVEILWTGEPIITKTGGPATYTIPNRGSAGPFTFTVADYLGHPMSAGTTITVEGTGLTVSGNANLVMVDTKSSGAGLTTFTISVEDSDPLVSNPPKNSILTVTVIHLVYGTVKLNLATGTVE